MLKYKEFCEKIKNEIIENMSSSFQNGYEVVIESGVGKNGEQTEQLRIVSHIPETQNIDAPIIALRAVYDKLYTKEFGGDFQSTVKALAYNYEEKYRSSPRKETMDIVQPQTPAAEETKFENIIFCVVCDSELLKDESELYNVPHIEESGMIVVFREVIEKDDEKLCTELITSEKLTDMNISLRDLYDIAKKNTPKILPAEVMKLDGDCYMISNKNHAYGASIMLYDGKMNVLSNIANETESNLMILPGSADEIYAIPVKENLEGLLEEYSDFSRLHSIVHHQSLLSEGVYLFNRNEEKLIYGEELTVMVSKAQNLGQEQIITGR